jgi:very-short-patch-repair endonuclease
MLKHMTDIFNHKHQKQIRKILRKQEAGAEKLLWSKLRNGQQGYKFRRQFGIGNCIADFYCPKLRLVIEVDGDTHSTKEEINNDKSREKFFNNLGMSVKRYTNYEVYKSMEAVLVDINDICLKLKNKLIMFDEYITKPHPSSPSQGEGE